MKNILTLLNSLPLRGGVVDRNCTRSVWGLKSLLDLNVVAKEELRVLVNSVYKPAIKLIDYTLEEDGITLFTHAPIPFNTIRAVANFLRITYQDDTKEDLKTTIDKINEKFSILVDDDLAYESFLKANTPLWDLIWNRWDETKDNDQSARPAKSLKGGYSITYVHGHDPFRSKYDHVINLDNFLGKYSRLDEPLRRLMLEKLMDLGDEKIKAQAMLELANRGTYIIGALKKRNLANSLSKQSIFKTNSLEQKNDENPHQDFYSQSNN